MISRYFLIAVFGLLVVMGCATSGVDFKWEDVNALKVGMNYSQVKAIMGPPTSTETNGDREVWVWAFGKANFLGSVEGKSASIIFENGRVLDVPTLPSEVQQELGIDSTAGNADKPDMPSPVYFESDIGEVGISARESAPAKALVNAVEVNPEAPYVAVLFKCSVNDLVTDYGKLVYDRDQGVLLSMTRTAMKVGNDSYSWRMWLAVSPSDFSAGLPYGRDDLDTVASSYSAPKASLYKNYTGIAEVIVWP